jgi:cell wall assembly regulator SMI1
VPEDGWKTTVPAEFVDVLVSGQTPVRADFGRVRRLLQPIPDQIAKQSTAFTLQALLTEWAVQSGRKWVFSLDAGAPAGATIDPRTGLLTWTASAPGTYPFTVRVSDPFEPQQTEAVTFTVSTFTVTLGATPVPPPDSLPLTPVTPPLAPVTPPFAPITPPVSTVGAFDPLTATWYLRDTSSAGAPSITPFAFGAPGWIALVGDWDGDGVQTIGAFDPATATWYLRNTNGPGAPDVAPFRYGAPGWVPVVGDWDGDGVDTIGVLDPIGQYGQAPATWYLRNRNSPGAPSYAPFAYGAAGWVPVVGDWDGDGVDIIGAFDPSGQFGQPPATWYLRNSNSPGAPSHAPFAYGTPAVQPVVGDWNGPPQALRAASSGKGSLTTLGDEEAGALLRAAVERLSAAGVMPPALLPEARVSVRDLPAGYLALAHRGTGLIEVDDDAAGHGWFVDATPQQDEEFDAAGHALPGSAAEGRMDLLTAMLHELDHLAGADDGDGLMGAALGAGTRHTDALDAAFADLTA